MHGVFVDRRCGSQSDALLPNAGYDLNSAGPSIESINGINLLGAPPVSILLGQDLIETSVMKSNGVSTKTSYLDQSLFSMACAVSDDGLCLFPLDVNVKLESPTAFPERTSYSLMEFKTLTRSDVDTNGETNGGPMKRAKYTMNGDVGMPELEDVMVEVSRLSELVTTTLEEETQTENFQN